MEFFLIIFILLTAIGLSNIVNHILPFIPTPLIQIMIGFLIAVVPGGFDVPLEPELFFVLFIAPILFNDGRNVSKRALWDLHKQILLLALGLVFLTVLVIGYLTHWLIPSIPLTAAFALAAILSPTDIVAVSAMAGRVRIPKDVMHLLEGEGLLNDASGLVAFNFAIAATVTGTFSLANASLSFLTIAIGGLAGGAILSFLIICLKTFIRRQGMEDVTFHMLIQILTPFAIFLAIEHFHLSGILAVVAAGIVHSINRDYGESPTINLQIVSNSTWSVLIYILNGLVFLLLGLQVPNILNSIFNDLSFNNLQVIDYTLIISTALFALRFIWLYMLEWNRWWLKKPDSIKPNIRMVAIATVGGVRGSVSLAGAFSIPFVMLDGSLFPQRALILFIAASVILVTLIVSSIFLPILTKSRHSVRDDNTDEMEKKALIRINEAAIASVREALSEDNRDAALSVIAGYNKVLLQLKSEEKVVDTLTGKKIETEIRLKALTMEFRYITKLIEEKQIDKKMAFLIQAHICQMEAALTNQFKFRFLMVWIMLKRALYQISQGFLLQNHEFKNPDQTKHKMISTRRDINEKAIEAVKQGLTPENEEISDLIIGEYRGVIARLQARRSEDYLYAFARAERGLKEKAFQSERDELQKLYENGKISREILQKIRHQINIRVAYFMAKEGF